MGITEKRIISRIAKSHGVSIEAAIEVYNHIGKFTKDAMEEAEKNEDGTFDPESFKVIHLSNFGKIVPNTRKIKEINKKKKIKNKSNNNKIRKQ